MENSTVTALMRFAKIKFHRVLPAHILAGINERKPGISTCPLMRLSVLFSGNGKPYAASFRLNGHRLGLYCYPEVGASGFTAHELPFNEEVTAYLGNAAEEARAIVQPVIHTH